MGPVDEMNKAFLALKVARSRGVSEVRNDVGVNCLVYRGECYENSGKDLRAINLCLRRGD